MSFEQLADAERIDTLAASAFHAHLGQCRHCAMHPFELCETGSALLKEVSCG